VKRHRRPTILRAYSRIDVRLERRDLAVDDAHILFGPGKFDGLMLRWKTPLAGRRARSVAISSATRPSVFDKEGSSIDHLANSVLPDTYSNTM
jgi:hypothetical protein